nr:MAG TPA: hypothetical protein [Caudoviricetes sp.]
MLMEGKTQLWFKFDPSNNLQCKHLFVYSF